MKKFVFIVSFVVLLKPVFPVFDYLINYDYIRTELCVNKETPVMGCNGKCYLMKQLAAASESEKPISHDKKQQVFETTDLFFSTLSQYDYPDLPSLNKLSVNAHYSNLYSSSEIHSFFHPPAIIS